MQLEASMICHVFWTIDSFEATGVVKSHVDSSKLMLQM